MRKSTLFILMITLVGCSQDRANQVINVSKAIISTTIYAIPIGISLIQDKLFILILLIIITCCFVFVYFKDKKKKIK